MPRKDSKDDSFFEVSDAKFDRRLFLKRFTFGIAGLAAVGSDLLTAKAFAQTIPFEPIEEGILLSESSEGVSIAGDIPPITRTAYAAYPAVTLDPKGRPAATWSAEQGDENAVFCMTFDPDSEQWLTEPILLTAESSSQGWLAYQPQIITMGEKCIVVWTETRQRAWRIVGRTIDPASNTPGQLKTIAHSDTSGFVVWKPTVAALSNNHIAVAWEERPDENTSFMVRAECFNDDLDPVGDSHVFGGTGTDEERTMEDSCRPSLAVSDDGKHAALVYDRYEGKGTTTVYLVLFGVKDSGLELRESIRVSHHPATNLSPHAVFSPDGELIWIGWHTNASDEDEWDIPRWYRVRAYSIAEKTLLDPAWPPESMDLDKDYTDQGFEFVRLACAADGTLCVLGRLSQRFCLQTYQDGEWSDLYRFPVEGWGGRGQTAPGVFDARGRLWVVRREIGANVLERIEGIGGGTSAVPALSRFQPPSALPGLRNIDTPIKFPPIEIEETVSADPVSPAPPAGEYHLYFGDIHNHSWMSDGMGDPDEGFRRARDLFQDDFYTLTDHDHFVSRKILHAEYEEQKAIVDRFNEPGRFVTLYAQEWTTPRPGLAHGYGHKNLYSITPDHPLIDNRNPSSRSIKDLYTLLDRHEMIAIPHHIGWTGIDWENHDPRLQPLVEICSVHGVFEYMGNGPIPHRGGRPGHFIRDGLDRGLRFGLCGGSDQHGLIWHHQIAWKRDAYRTGITGVLARELTRDAIFEAFRHRRTFATTGIKLRPVFTVAGLHMGQEGTVTKPPQIQVDVLALDRIKWVTIVRNGEDWLRSGGEAHRARITLVDDKLPEDKTSYYYLRIEMADGNMAWTSPIWVTPAA